MRKKSVPDSEPEHVPVRYFQEFQAYCRSSWATKEDLVQSARREMQDLLPVVSSVLDKEQMGTANEEEMCRHFLRCSVDSLNAELWLDKNREAWAEILEAEPSQMDVQHPLVAPIWLKFATAMRLEWEQDWQSLRRVCGWEDT